MSGILRAGAVAGVLVSGFYFAALIADGSPVNHAAAILLALYSIGTAVGLATMPLGGSQQNKRSG